MSSLHQMPFGAELTAEGVRFSLWAPDAAQVELVVDSSAPVTAQRDDEGFARLTVPTARAGSRYQWRINGSVVVPDPASRFQPDGVFAPSIVTDPTAFEWLDRDWTGRPWTEAVIYEAHIGTATTAGTFEAFAERLDALADLGVTMIELMPIADCPGERNWGYDGVLPFAPNSAYGSPDDLKRLVDRAHARGIMMMLDVVYNHFGPSGNFLSLYAKSFFTDRHMTPWGSAIDFDQTKRRAVRDFVIHNALYWIDEFHFDGLRLDAVHAIKDDSDRHLLAELSDRVHELAGNRHVHLVLENEHNSASWLERENGRARHFDAQWNDDVHHCWHVLLTGESESYYRDFTTDTIRKLGRCLSEGFAYQGDASAHAGGIKRGESSRHLPPEAFVSFVQNHDQIGNRATGERLSMLTEPERLDVAHAMLLLAPQIPMLFMGEEWSASTPFLFFVDFSDDPDLSRAVREGRAREFAGFAAYGGKTVVPDPTDPSTYAASVLRWEERIRAPHGEKLAEMRRLLALRGEHIVPLVKSGLIESGFEATGENGLDASWRFNDGTLRMHAQLGSGRREIKISPTAEILWSARGVVHEDGRHLLTDWTAVISKESPRGAD